MAGTQAWLQQIQWLVELMLRQLPRHIIAERAKAFGILGSSFGIGLALGPLVGGVFSSGLGWRWIFFVNIPVGLSVLALAVPRMNESSDPGATRVDWAGLVTFTLSLFLFIYALIGGPEEGWGSPRIVGALLGAVVSVALFVVAEQLQRCPMFDLNLFRKPTFVAAMVLPVAVAFDFVALLVYIPLYFQSVNGYSPIQAGLVVMPLTVPVLFVPTLVGRLTERISVRVLLTSRLILIGLGALLMSGLEAGGSWTTLVDGLFVTGVGTGVCNGLMDNLAISVAPSERSGMAAGIFNTMRLAGDAIAIALSGAILISLTKSRLLDLIWGTPAATGIQTAELANSVARGDIQGAVAFVPIAGRALFLQAATQSYTNTLNTVFIILACISFAGAVLTLILVRKRDIVEEPMPLNQP